MVEKEEKEKGEGGRRWASNRKYEEGRNRRGGGRECESRLGKSAAKGWGGGWRVKGERNRGRKRGGRVDGRPMGDPAQHTTQPLDFFFSRGAGARTARIASSKTFLRPFCVSAEHSRYLTVARVLHQYDLNAEQRRDRRRGRKEGRRTAPPQSPSPSRPPAGTRSGSSSAPAACRSCRGLRANRAWFRRG